MERIILDKLNWDLHTATPLDFLHIVNSPEIFLFPTWVYSLILVTGTIDCPLSWWGRGAALSLWLLRLFSSFGEQGLWNVWAQSLQLPGSRAQAQWFWHTGLGASQHVGSSQIRDQTHVSCTGRQILYHWASRDFLLLLFWFLGKGKLLQLAKKKLEIKIYIKSLKLKLQT